MCQERDELYISFPSFFPHFLFSFPSAFLLPFPANPRPEIVQPATIVPVRDPGPSRERDPDAMARGKYFFTSSLRFPASFPEFYVSWMLVVC